MAARYIPACPWSEIPPQNFGLIAERKRRDKIRTGKDNRRYCANGPDVARSLSGDILSSLLGVFLWASPRHCGKLGNAGIAPPRSEVTEWRSLLRDEWARAMRALFFAVVVLFAATADADPPPNADPALAPWFRSLLQPGTSISCCSISDCRATDYRVEGDHYEALIGEKWFVVPPDKILQRTDNPTGRAVVCWTPQRGIVCFVRATES